MRALFRRQIIPALFWCAALALAIGSYSLTNDQFGRIAPARQIVQFGELPFRDYLDPGYYFTELSSAALQRLLGDNLLGELLLNTTFIATGSLCVLLLVRRLSGSTLAGIAAALVGLVSIPRAYDYDKVLFYPLGLLVLWRFLERPGFGRLFALAVTIVVAGLFRYDTGVYLGVAALIGIVVRHGLARAALRDTAVLIATTLMLCLPFMLFIQWNGGLADAVDQMLTYGVREGARTRLTSLPRITPGRLMTLDDPSVGARIAIRWTPDVATTGRVEAASRLGLTREAPENPEARTWSYVIDDESTDHIRRIVNDPAVEDTARIDRRRLRLEDPTSTLSRLGRRFPLLRTHLLPDFWSDDNAGALLFYIVVGLPVIAIVLLAARTLSRSVPAVPRSELASLASLVALTVLVDLFILRDPIGARIGGMAGPPVVLGAWLGTQLPRPRRSLGVAALWIGALATVVVVLSAFSVTGVWSQHLRPVFHDASRISEAVRAASVTPPNADLIPTGRDAAIIDYVNRCTLPDDRVFATWFFPELYWFSQRGFSGEMVVMFGQHWSEPRFQERTVRAFQAHQVPIVLVQTPNIGELRDVYPQVAAYLTARYRLGGTSNFGDTSRPADAYSVFVPKDRAPVRIDSQWGLPCFAASLR